MKKYVVIISGILIVIFVEVIMMLGCYCKRAGISSLEDSNCKSSEADKDEENVRSDSIFENKMNVK